MPLNPFSPSSDVDPVTPRPASGPFPEIPDADSLIADAATSHTDTEPVTAGQAAAAVRESSAEIAAVTDTPADPEMDVTTDASRRGEPGVIYQEPEPEKDTPTLEPAKRPDGRSTSKQQRRRFSQVEARRVRERYAYRREMATAMESAEDWESVADTETGIAREFESTRPAIRNIVLGTTYPDAGGPIDTRRRARRDQYETEKDMYGPEVALSKYMSYRPGDTPIAARIGVVVREPGSQPREYSYPAGTRVEVYTCTDQDNGDQDTEADK